MKRFVLLWLSYTGLCMTLASSVYFLLEKIMFRIDDEHGYVFGALARMFLYHYQHPYQYIAIVAFVYGVVATLWIMYCGAQIGWKRRLAIVLVMGVTLILSSIPGGILWVIHEMQPGVFPKGQQFWDALMWGAQEGLRVGWMIIALSVPYNIIVIVVGYWTTGFIEEKVRINK